MNFLQGLLLVITILLITIVLLQSGKAEGASQVIMGGDISLLLNEKNVVQNYL